MRVHAVVPLKEPARGKSRLAGALTGAQRIRLIRTMLGHVVGTVAAVRGIERVSVLTADPALVPPEAGHLPDAGEELNVALAHAARALRPAGADVLLIIAADLPFVTAEEIAALVEASRGAAATAPGFVAAPDWTDAGTNALAVPLAREVPTRFGPESLAAHETAARAAHLSWTIVRRPGLAFDVDEPAQLEALVRAGGDRYEFLSGGCDAARADSRRA